MMITLQNIIFPDRNICTEYELYFHTSGNSGFSSETSSLWLAANSNISFDTFFNALSIGKWHTECQLENLFLTVEGEGEGELLVVFSKSDRSWEILYSEHIHLSADAPHTVDLSHFHQHGTDGIIFFKLKALHDTTLTGARYHTDTPPEIRPKLAISITTFRREAEVQNTAARLDALVRESDYKDDIRVFVVDNGQTAIIEDTEIVTYMPNANLGGAGGFARGLMEAENGNFTHCLFMDDDATFHMENILRTYAFLALTKDPKAALAGAMISNTHKWRMWESGAIFDRTCHPLFCGLDLRYHDNILEMEVTPSRHDDPGFYGGWWYFAFPIAAVENYPFPFFVRGDDINFSLTNDFKINTLNGIVSFQDDFSDKETAQTLYLDLRNHLVQHLTVEAIHISATKCANISLWFLARALSRFHYETAEALLLSWNDVLSGPGFFAANADMATRRSDIGKLINDEKWKPVSDLDLDEHIGYDAYKGYARKFFRTTLNGHLLPFFSMWGNRPVICSLDRSSFAKVWGASQLTYLNAAMDKGYTVKHSKLRFFALLAKIFWTYIRFVLGYNKLRKAYKNEYPKLASKDFWNKIPK